jgi:hypothetical protein
LAKGEAWVQRGFSKAVEKANGNANRPAAMSIPLPAGWSEHLDPKSEQVFYHNKTTNVVTWKRSECFEDADSYLRAVAARAAPPARPPVRSDGSHVHADSLYTQQGLRVDDPRFCCRSSEIMTATQRARAERQRRRGGAYDESQSIFDRLTDESLYTGAHVSRFRDRPLVPNPVVLDPSLARTQGAAGRPKDGTIFGKRPPPPPPSQSGAERVVVRHLNPDDPRLVCRPKKRAVLNERQRKRKDAFAGRPIFERLTDHKMYTGTHKHRFDEYGRGRGARGRDRLYKMNGVVGLRDPYLQYNGSTSSKSRPGENRVFTCPSQFLVR